MKGAWIALALACLLAVPALAEESGRKAKVYLRDGAILDGVVLGCASGVLELATSSQKHSIDLDSISRIEFGEAVGPHVRIEHRMLDLDDRRDGGSGTAGEPPSRGRTGELDDGASLLEGLRAGPLGPDEERRRRLNEFVRWVGRLNMFRQLELSTDYFRDAALIQKAAADWEVKLRATPEKGEANKDVRLALTTLAVAAQQRLRAHALLASLKKDYPDDEALQKLTIGALEFAVLRARLAAAKPRVPEVRPVPPRLRGQFGQPD